MPDGSAPAVAVLFLLPPVRGGSVLTHLGDGGGALDGRLSVCAETSPMTTLSVLAEAPPNQPAALRSSIAGPRCAAGRVFGACMASVQSVAAGAPSGRTEFSS